MSNELQEVKKSSYLMAAESQDSDNSDELAGLDFSFDKIKVPSGGGLAFEVINAEGKEDAAKELRGVIVYQHPLRSYYEGEYQGGNEPPICGSANGVYGTQYGRCAECPYAVFGSGKNGGTACKSKRCLYILLENTLFPVILNIPTSSLKNFSDYMKRLKMRGLSATQVVSVFSLVKDKNEGGIVYSKVQVATDRILEAAEQVAIKKITESVRSFAARQPVEAAVDEPVTPKLEPLSDAESEKLPF